MKHKALIRRLQISCLGLDRIDPLCLLVDDVIAALAQTERAWVGLTDEEISEVLGSDIHDEPSGELRFIRAIEAKLKEKNT
jgi:hypothetical protein